MLNDSFLSNEDGAISVDWTVMTAAVVGLGLASAAAVRTGTSNMAESVRDSLSNASVASLAWGERVLQSFDFSNRSAEGWSRQTFGHSVVWGDFLGPFGGETLTNPVTHEIKLSPGASSAVVEFDLLVIDSWDGLRGMRSAGGSGDAMLFQVNGQTISMEHFAYTGHPDSAMFPNALADRTATATINGTTYTMNMTNRTHATNDGGAGWNDQVWRVQLEATNPPQTFNLGFSTNASQAVADESFGINNYVVRENF